MAVTVALALILLAGRAAMMRSPVRGQTGMQVQTAQSEPTTAAAAVVAVVPVLPAATVLRVVTVIQI
jgi:hypothetical protein